MTRARDREATALGGGGGGVVVGSLAGGRGNRGVREPEELGPSRS